eukprot:TRINITY_DN11230_c0_g1_i3.p1 TRINITY_DN11230_c0_g1~~TRINITY_DN11230_c0_g1_i3.p1  ORF type:complete len:284 (+),score=12.89 TRINITY_DN11230_c0_g1_i3:47-898(+)
MRASRLLRVKQKYPFMREPVIEDDQYWPLDKKLRLWVKDFYNICISYGFLTSRPWQGMSAPSRADASEGETAVASMYERRGIGHPPLMMMAPRGPHTLENFSITSDQVLGGHSEAFLDLTEDNHLLFHGTLRISRDPVRMAAQIGHEIITDDYVGYASFECYVSRIHFHVLSKTRGIEIRCRGSQTPFIFKYAHRGMDYTESLNHMFVPTDEWRCYILRFDHMRKIMNGVEVPGSKTLSMIVEKRQRGIEPTTQLTLAKGVTRPLGSSRYTSTSGRKMISGWK